MTNHNEKKKVKGKQLKAIHRIKKSQHAFGTRFWILEFFLPTHPSFLPSKTVGIQG